MKRLKCQRRCDGAQFATHSFNHNDEARFAAWRKRRDTRESRGCVAHCSQWRCALFALSQQRFTMLDAQLPVSGVEQRSPTQAFSILQRARDTRCITLKGFALITWRGGCFFFHCARAKNRFVPALKPCSSPNAVSRSVASDVVFIMDKFNNVAWI